VNRWRGATLSAPAHFLSGADAIAAV